MRISDIATICDVPAANVVMLVGQEPLQISLVILKVMMLMVVRPNSAVTAPLPELSEAQTMQLLKCE